MARTVRGRAQSGDDARGTEESIGKGSDDEH